MSQKTIAEILHALRDSIARAKTSTPTSTMEESDPTVERVLAYLWSAHDELERLSAHPFV